MTHSATPADTDATDSPGPASPSAAPANTATVAPATGAFSQPYRWTILGIAVTAQTTASIVSQGLYTLVPFFQQDFALSQAGAALAVAAVNGGQLLSMLLMGWLIDLYGERSVVSLSMLAMGAMGMLAATTRHYPLLLACLVLLGACYAAVQPGGTRAMVRWFSPAQRGMATGIRQAGLPLGTALAAMALPWMAQQGGWQSALLAQGAVGIAGGLLFMLLYRNAEGSAAQAVTPPPTPLQLVRDVARYQALWPVMLAGVAMVTYQYTFATHVLSFLHQRFGMTVVAAGLLYSISQWFGIAGRVGLAWVSDHFWPNRRMRSLVFTMAVCVIATLVLALLPAQAPDWLLAALFIVVGVFGVGWYPLYLLQVAEMAPPAAMASTISFSMTLNMAAIAVIPPLFGLVVDVSGYTLAWVTLASGVVVALLNLRRGSGRAEAARLRSS